MRKQSQVKANKLADELAQQFFDKNCGFAIEKKRLVDRKVFPVEARFCLTLIHYINMLLVFASLCCLIFAVADQFGDLGITLWLLTQDARVEPIGYYQR